MVRNTVARRERRYKYYFERNADGKWIPVPFDKSASASASAAIDKPDDADEPDDDLPLAERRKLATGERRKLGVEERHGMRPPEEKPDLVRLPPKEKPRKRPPQKKPKLQRERGVLYPEYYHGLIDDTYIEVAWKIESSAKNCRLLFGEKKDVYIDVPDLQIAPEDRDDYERGLILVRKKARVWFYKWGEGNINADIWPFKLDTDLFDAIHLKIPNGKTAETALITVVLNGITILGPDMHFDRITGTLNLSRYIAECRLQQVPHSMKSPVLHRAALELGKAWSPKYGGVWEKDEGRFKAKPEKWCSEFAGWVIRKATKLEPPEGDVSVSDMARYFMGLEEDSDLQGFCRFIGPNKRIVIWDNREKTVNNTGKLDPEFREELGPNPVGGYPTEPTYYFEKNPRYCPWKELGTRVKPGYYVKTKRGRDKGLRGWSSGNEQADWLLGLVGVDIEEGKTKEHGHSTLFVGWVGGFHESRSQNEFRGLGGNQNGRVCIKIFKIDREHDKRHAKEESDFLGFETRVGHREILNDIFWKESWHATDEYGYFDGFGVTDMVSKPRLRIMKGSHKWQKL